jgi:hypothetical protein
VWIALSTVDMPEPARPPPCSFLTEPRRMGPPLPPQGTRARWSVTCLCHQTACARRSRAGGSRWTRRVCLPSSIASTSTTTAALTSPGSVCFWRSCCNQVRVCACVRVCWGPLWHPSFAHPFSPGPHTLLTHPHPPHFVHRCVGSLAVCVTLSPSPLCPPLLSVSNSLSLCPPPLPVPFSLPVSNSLSLCPPPLPVPFSLSMTAGIARELGRLWRVPKGNPKFEVHTKVSISPFHFALPFSFPRLGGKVHEAPASRSLFFLKASRAKRGEGVEESLRRCVFLRVVVSVNLPPWLPCCCPAVPRRCVFLRVVNRSPWLPCCCPAVPRRCVFLRVVNRSPVAPMLLSRCP